MTVQPTDGIRAAAPATTTLVAPAHASYEQAAEHACRVLRDVLGLEVVYAAGITPDVFTIEVIDGGEAYGMGGGATLPTSETLCTRALSGRGPRYTTQAAVDFPDVPVAGALGVNTYVMVPLVGPDGAAYGTLCGLDRKAVELSAGQLQLLELVGGLLARERELEELRRRDREARRVAERSSRAKTEFLSRMSHELRTPLNAILGFGQLLSLGDLHPDEAESVDQVLQAGKHLLQLVDDVVDVSRIEARQLALAPEPLPLEELVTQAVNLVAPVAVGSRISVRVEQVVGATVVADRLRLRQVLVNLLTNGIKYNRPGGTVTVSAEAAPDDAGVRIVVADTGIGLAPDRLSSAFTPFERCGAEQTAVEGSGIGLALVKALVEGMGGAVSLESEVGRGTRAVVDLPGLPPPSAVTAAGSRSTVLYVEDNASNIVLMRKVLSRRAAAELVVADDGQTGLDLARQLRPALILLDLHLPGLGGAEVLAALKADPALAAIPVLVLTADATPGLAQMLLTAGASGFCLKPLDLPALLTSIDRYLAPAA